MSLEKIEETRKHVTNIADISGRLLVEFFHYLALFAIGGSIVWSAIYTFIGMTAEGHAAIDGILLLFIYLELGAMIGIYFKTNHMPVRFLMYVAVTALVRMLIGDIQAHHSEITESLLIISGAILMLAIANLIFRFASSKYPSAEAN